MIIGTGIDLVEVVRITSSFAKFGDRFLSRILVPNEIAYCLAHKNPGPFIAARFAAKEAVAKAFGTGIGAELGWLDMEVGRKVIGEPFIIMLGKGRDLFATRGARQLHLSLTHTENYAAACAILEN